MTALSPPESAGPAGGPPAPQCPPAGHAWQHLLPQDPGGRRSGRPPSLAAGPRARVAHLLAMRVCVPLLAMYVRTVFRVRISGHIPPGPTLLICQHTSDWDGVVSGLLDPRIKPVVKARWLDDRRFAWFLRSAGAIPTGGGTVDRAVTCLESGFLVWIAPRGFTPRNPARPVRSGAATIARRTGAAVVPITFTGLSRVRSVRHLLPSRPRRPVSIWLGHPLDIPEAASEPEISALFDRVLREQHAAQRARDER